jgi:hypothetical protein
MLNPPIACALTPDQLNASRDHLLPGLATRAQSSEVLPDGYRLRFGATSDTLQAIANTIDRERQCCQFLRFQLTIEPGSDSIVLDVTGPDGTREFLRDLLTL